MRLHAQVSEGPLSGGRPTPNRQRSPASSLRARRYPAWPPRYVPTSQDSQKGLPRTLQRCRRGDGRPGSWGFPHRRRWGWSWSRTYSPAGTPVASRIRGSRQVCVCPAFEWFPSCGFGVYPSETPDLSRPDPATRGDRANRNGEPTSRTARRAGLPASRSGSTRTSFPYYGDVAGLDGNDDGIPCQSLPGAP